MRYYIIWFTDIDENDVEYESYLIVLAQSINDAWRQAFDLAGDYVVSVEPYEP